MEIPNSEEQANTSSLPPRIDSNQTIVSGSEKTKRKRLSKRLKKIALFFAKYIIAYIYLGYFWFVWKTSKVTSIGQDVLQDTIHKTILKKAICALWHQDVAFVAWAFRYLHPSTIASVGDGGDIIAHLLQKCGYVVFRGGSSKSKKRRKKILEEFSEYVQVSPGPVAVGITVDGSSGPIYQMKRGVIVMAMESGAPIFLVRTWCKRKFNLPTWDATTFPLPFNVIEIVYDGPHYFPENTKDEQVFEEFHRKMEDRLLNLAYQSFLKFDGKFPPQYQKFFPPNWKPSDGAKIG